MLQIDYDPEIITYEELLQVFWNSHDATNQPWSIQYMSLLLVHDEQQEELARSEMEKREKQLQKKLYTEIRPLDRFYIAEDYHQKYYLQSDQNLVRALRVQYPDMKDFINSTAAARLNGFLGGYGSKEELALLLVELGLRDKGK